MHPPVATLGVLGLSGPKLKELMKMADGQVQKGKATSKSEDVEDAKVESVKNEELEEETDDLLDEIDDVLEENSQDFVNAFVQKGGE